MGLSITIHGGGFVEEIMDSIVIRNIEVIDSLEPYLDVVYQRVLEDNFVFEVLDFVALRINLLFEPLNFLVFVVMFFADVRHILLPRVCDTGRLAGELNSVTDFRLEVRKRIIVITLPKITNS